MHIKYSRRWFIKVAALLGLAGTGATKISAGNEVADDPLLWRLATFLTNAENANVIGQAYLNAVPEEYNSYVIMHRIEMNHPIMTSELRTVNESDTNGLIANMVTEDFSKENIVQLNGWILSRTEARLCALTSIFARV